MHFTNINGILTSPNLTSFRYKAILTKGIGLLFVICGVVKVVKFSKHLKNFFFQKTKINPSISTYVCNILGMFLSLNGTNRVVVINSLLT